MGSTERHYAHRHGRGPDHLSDVLKAPIGRPAGYRSGPHSPVHSRPHQVNTVRSPGWPVLRSWIVLGIIAVAWIFAFIMLAVG